MNDLNLKSRSDFPGVLNEMNLTGVAVEVGVDRGAYSELFLSKWAGDTLVLVDPWKPCRSSSRAKWNVPAEEQEERIRVTKNRLSRFEGRFRIVREASLEAVQGFDDESIDFVHIDGDHRYLSVMADVEEWSKKVRPGGIVSGHDYFNIADYGGIFVKRAVNEYVLRQKIRLQVIQEKGRPNTWFFVKPCGCSSS